ncbi:MAG TPA: transcriptional repressor LexA [Gemmataceae bacterium]|nr:transcriptional repressor LexA [Gemmataceae bacterium]
MADMNVLTTKQRHIYEFIRERIENRGYGPSIREICTAFKIKSPNGVMCHLKALEKKGFIKRPDEPLARAIQLTTHRRPGPMLPMLGLVAAGPTIEAIEQKDEEVDFHDFCGNNCFALKVKGQSMIEDHIEDGDLVVVRKQDSADNGDRVVAMIDGEVTLKRFQRKKGNIMLEPANSTMSPIHVTPDANVRILGVLVGVLRKC